MQFKEKKTPDPKEKERQVKVWQNIRNVCLKLINPSAKMIREAKADEKKGNKFYLRMASKLPERKRKKVVSGIAAQERHHRKRLEELEKELMC